MESHITGEMIIKKGRKKVKEETKKGGRDRGKRREGSDLNEGKSLIYAGRMESAKTVDEAHFLSFTAIIAT